MLFIAIIVFSGDQIPLDRLDPTRCQLEKNTPDLNRVFLIRIKLRSTRNPFYPASIRNQANAGRITIANLNCEDNSNFALAFNLEQIHNRILVEIGGEMSSLTEAPFNPIF